MKFNHYTIKYNAILFLIISIFSYDKVTKTVETEEHQETEKGVVELMQAQVKASQIVLGNFERKNLSEVITANSYTKFPLKIRQMYRFYEWNRQIYFRN